VIHAWDGRWQLAPRANPDTRRRVWLGCSTTPAATASALPTGPVAQPDVQDPGACDELHSWHLDGYDFWVVGWAVTHPFLYNICNGHWTFGQWCSGNKGSTYRPLTGNRRPPVPVYRTGLAGYRSEPDKFKFKFKLPRSTGSYRYTGRLDRFTGRFDRYTGRFDW